MKKPFVHLNEQGHRRGKICNANTKYRCVASNFLKRLQMSNSEENLSQRRRKTSTKQRTYRQLFFFVKNNKRGAFKNLTYRFNE